MVTFNVFTSVTFFLLFVTSCFAKSAKIPLVIRPDCGTCGNACCTMEYILFGPKPPEAFQIVSAELKSGGPDGMYMFIDGQDIRKENQTAQFIIQAGHASTEYMDMLNFAFYDNPSVAATTVIAFSISTKPVSFCDDGSNYNNLIALMNTTDYSFTEVHIAGCPPAPFVQKKSFSGKINNLR